MEVQVDFDVFPPQESDFISLKRFLQNYLGDTQWAVSELADLIIAQSHVGSLLKVADDEDDETFGLISVVNIHRYKNLACVQQILHYILSKAKDETAWRRLQALITDESKPLALLLNERVVNAPPQLAPLLHSALFEEIRNAHNQNISGNSNEDSKSPQMWDFENFLILTNTYTLSTGRPSMKRKTKINEETFFYKLEDQIYLEEASLSFSFPLMGSTGSGPEEAGGGGGGAGAGPRWTLEGRTLDHRLVMVVHRSKISSILAKMHRLFAPDPSAVTSSSSSSSSTSTIS